eukprot:TRINITY_DN15712_c0_g1_i1.p1 TRINITY_DN15712_c0_g1~~TRINITY_DN15712_c0_g1_i1.p1  ORF type:complete len:265 (-),score=61.86 TRINITY_DN15712_c0_g1_i1:289-1026(-)
MSDALEDGLYLIAKACAHDTYGRLREAHFLYTRGISALADAVEREHDMERKLEILEQAEKYKARARAVKQALDNFIESQRGYDEGRMEGESLKQFDFRTSMQHLAAARKQKQRGDLKNALALYERGLSIMKRVIDMEDDAAAKESLKTRMKTYLDEAEVVHGMLRPPSPVRFHPLAKPYYDRALELLLVAEELLSLYREREALPRIHESIRLLRLAIGHEAPQGKARNLMYSALDRANRLLRSAS